ncbi:TonB-dependent receptor [Sphingomonas aliaeris]|uniref:TonB-dependent receptor n=1 Tax=Sphingomonas aliaeris TaxID=2759526 RepID=A0A974S407_9SPHN|nr:TonB-dependent receptor [Sphingomonas aliaeris]QQV76929.1 TonB-dependent receptor [Sphingomonas aliaeris]
MPAAAQTVAGPPTPAPVKPTYNDTVTTGVAKGRDRLDSATSTSTLRDVDIAKLAPRSTGELLRDLPGIRSEASTGEGYGNLTIRGLPIATSGVKFVQLQEDGLPVFEFGDLQGMGADSLIRADLNLSQVEVIRGGSASTFASNSPGGIINFVSKTGDVEGGAIALTAGLDYGLYRSDFDYGARLSDTLRFHIGGFYRQGEGPRRAGYDAQKGGQIKVNITKEFAGGYIRLYGKYLNDRTPFYDAAPMMVTGTNDDPKYSDIASFDANHDTMLSRNIRQNVVLDRNNTVAMRDIGDGHTVKSSAFGVETQFELAGWTITDRFRYATASGGMTTPFTSAYLPAALALGRLGGAGARASYANGPLAGQAITSPATLNGNGLIAILNILDLRVESQRNVTNDIRGSRTFELGGGNLTTTGGFYAGRQTVDIGAYWTTKVSEVRGDGRAALINVFDATGRPLTENGVYAYNLALAGGTRRRSTIVDYAVNAPFASVNYHVGRIAIGASVRYDYGTAKGFLLGSDLGGGRVGTITQDVNRDGVISAPETMVGVTPLTSPAPVDYSYNYLSYSTGVNFRIAEPIAVFARYSRGGRANGERILFSPIVSTTTGALNVPSAAADPVKQAEIGVKYRRSDLTLNLTGFWAKAQDSNVDSVTNQPVARMYRATGVEFEGGYRTGIFSLTAGGTYTSAKILADQFNPANVGKTPRRQAKFTFQTTPQIMTDRFAVGAAFIGTTGSYAQDNDALRVPGYVTTNAFVQVRPTEKLLLSLNANNLFDTLAIVSVDEAAIPATGIVRVRPLNGRTVSATARFDF